MSRLPRVSGFFLTLLPLLWAGSATAHLTLTNPSPRLGGQTGGNQLKSGPCGQTQNARTDNVTEFMPGETITVEWDEYINHPSYYRISFDVDGDDDFVIRTDMDSIDPDTDDPEAAEPLDDVILAYVEEDPDMSSYSIDVTLPNVQCENCTLQVIQFMYDKVGNGANDEYYFQCADIALRGEVLGTGGGSGDGGTSGGGTAGDGGSASGGAGTSDGGMTSSSGGAATGGSATATGGMATVGGTSSTGGAVASGGVTGSGGTSPSAGGASSAGGATGSGGSSAGGTAGDPNLPPGMQDMGGCSLTPSPSARLGWLFSLLGLGLIGFRRVRRRVVG